MIAQCHGRGSPNRKKLTEISFGFRICSRVEVSSQLLDVQGLVDLGLDTLALENRVLLQGLAANDVPAIKLLGKKYWTKICWQTKEIFNSHENGQILSGRKDCLQREEDLD